MQANSYLNSKQIETCIWKAFSLLRRWFKFQRWARLKQLQQISCQTSRVTLTNLYQEKGKKSKPIREWKTITEYLIVAITKAVNQKGNLKRAPSTYFLTLKTRLNQPNSLAIKLRTKQKQELDKTGQVQIVHSPFTRKKNNMNQNTNLFLSISQQLKLSVENKWQIFS